MNVRIPENPRPSCGALINTATNPTDDTLKPEPGDITMCLYCGELFSFGPALDLRPLDIPADADSGILIEIQRMRSAWAKLRENRWAPGGGEH